MNLLVHPLPASLTCTPGDALLSVVVPVRDEADNIAALVGEIHAALVEVPHEVVYVDDGSSDGSAAILADAAAHGLLRWRRHRAGSGQSAALVTGVTAARGVWIATLDGDGQNDPADIPRLLAHAAAGNPPPALVVGHRIRRRDSAVKRISSRVANAVRARLLGDSTPDTGCGLKLFRREVFLQLPQFDHMHRFLPALVLRAGGRVESVPVNHRPRRHGRSKYGTLDRLFAGLFDLVGVFWLQRRRQRVEVDVPEQPDP
jgi:dolichol-phosphate mannosyltransferase